MFQWASFCPKFVPKEELALAVALPVRTMVSMKPMSYTPIMPLWAGQFSKSDMIQRAITRTSRGHSGPVIRVKS